MNPEIHKTVADSLDTLASQRTAYRQFVKVISLFFHRLGFDIIHEYDLAFPLPFSSF